MSCSAQQAGVSLSRVRSRATFGLGALFCDEITGKVFGANEAVVGQCD